MSKKIIPLTLAAVSAAMFVLSAAASANWGVTPTNANFTSTGPTAKLFANGEPTIECKGSGRPAVNTGSGTYEDGTTGTVTLHFTECQAEFLGITVPCSTILADPGSKTIVTSGNFHNVTITSGKRGILVTPLSTVIKCQNIANMITVSGDLIGEVTSPTTACPVVTKTIAFKFGVITEPSPITQAHKTIDGSVSEYDLSATTVGGAVVTAALKASATNTFIEPEAVTIDCNTP